MDLARLPELPNFRKLRTERGLTLREVEEATKISNAYLSQLETGKVGNPSYQIVKTLVDYYITVEPLNSFKKVWNAMQDEIQKNMDEWDEEKKERIAQASKDLEELIITL